MRNGKVRIWFGLVLIIAQLFGLGVLSSSGMKLWDTLDTDATLLAPSGQPLEFDSGYDPDERISTPLFGFYMGVYKLELTLGEEAAEFFGIEEENDYSYEYDTAYDDYYSDSDYDNDYRKVNKYQLSYLEKISRDIRAEMYYEDSFVLDVYDFSIFLGYFSWGILGFILLISGIRAQNAYDSFIAESYYVDMKMGPGRHFGVVAGLVCLVAILAELIIQMSMELSLLQPLFLLRLMPPLLLAVFFFRYYGKQESALISCALMFLCLYYLYQSGVFFGSYYLSNRSSDYLPNGWTELEGYYLFSFLTTAVGAIFLGISGIRFYKYGYKDENRRDVMLGMIFCLGFILFAPLVAGIEDSDDYFEAINLAPALPLVTVTLYMWCVFVRDPRMPKPVENPCPSCGSDLGRGNSYCLRCGESSAKPIPVTVTSPAPAPRPVLTSTIHAPGTCICGEPKTPGFTFCGKCGRKL